MDVVALGLAKADAAKKYATAQSVSTAYGIASRGFPVRTRPVEKMVGYFGATHTWTATNQAGGASNLADTAQPMLGTQSARLDVPVNNSGQLNSPTLTAFPVTGRNVRLWFRYTGAITGIIIYFASDAGYTNRTAKNVLSLGDFPADTDHVVELSLSEFVAAGTPDLANITNVRILAQTSTGGTGSVWAGGVALTKDAAASLPNGAAILSFDDSNIDHWTYARPKLAQYGMSGTLYPNIANLGAGAGNYTLTQAQYMQNLHGFDVGSHCIDQAHHIDHVGQTEAWLRDHFEQIIAANKANGFRGNSFAWPNTTSDLLARRVAADYFRSARGGNSNYNEVFPPLNPMISRAINGGSFTIAQLKAFVDRAKAGHSVAHFFFHSLPTTKSAANDVARQDLYDLVDYIAGQSVPVLNMSQFMDLPLSA